MLFFSDLVLCLAVFINQKVTKRMKLIILLSLLIICCNAEISCKSGVELTIDGGDAPGSGISTLKCADGEICLAAEGEVHILDDTTHKHKKCKPKLISSGFSVLVLSHCEKLLFFLKFWLPSILYYIHWKFFLSIKLDFI